MSELLQAIEQLEKAVGRAEAMVKNAEQQSEQQNLFGDPVLSASQNESCNDGPSNIHYLNPEDLESKLTTMIDKMETLLEEGS